jgi:hypothetical protein
VAGRPTKLTPEIQQTIVEILRNCGTRTAAAARAGVAISSFMEWMSRGAAAGLGIYRDFRIAVLDAEAQATLFAVRTVRLSIAGGWHKVPMRDKDGNYVFKRDPMTGEILRDAQGRPEAELADEYKEPDSGDARWFLERRAREDFGNHEPAVTVNMNSAPARPRPNKKEMLDLFSQAVQILVDNGMKVPEPAMLEHQGQKAIETTAIVPAGVLATTPSTNSNETTDADLLNVARVAHLSR